jgi:hypothetical protein
MLANFLLYAYVSIGQNISCQTYELWFKQGTWYMVFNALKFNASEGQLSKVLKLHFRKQILTTVYQGQYSKCLGLLNTALSFTYHNKNG